MVEQAPRRGHQHFDATSKRFGLWIHVHSTEDHRGAKVGVFGVTAQAFLDLGGQFACGSEYERANRMPCRGCACIGMRKQSLQQRQSEPGCFSRTRLRATKNISTCKHKRNGLNLYGGRFGVALLLDGSKQLGA